MKIVHLNAFDGNGGASKAAYRLNKALMDAGVNSKLLVNVKNNRKDTTTVELNKNWFIKKYVLILRILEFLAVKLFVKPVQIPFSLPVKGRNINKNKFIKDADIIHLHWINQGFLSPKSIRQLGKINKPIVWTMHDSNAFTGGCHVRYECENFKTECKQCPVLKHAGKKDLSNYFWNKKRKAYNKLPLTIITPGTWMYQSVKQSALLQNKTVYHIPNTLDTDVFKPLLPDERIRFRKTIGWQEETFVILSGFMPSKVLLHKGTKYFEESIINFLSKYNQQEREKIKIVFFGIKPDNNPFPFQVEFIGRINEEEKLAKFYAAADVFLTTTIEDNFPNTVLESLSCGTPVVSFKTGGIPDMVKHKENGFLADYKENTGIVQGLLYILNHEQIDVVRKNARDTVIKKFSPSIISKEHLVLYNKLLNSGVL